MICHHLEAALSMQIHDIKVSEIMFNEKTILNQFIFRYYKQ